MNQHTQSIQQRKEEVLKIIVNCLIQYLELDQTTDNPEWSPSIMLTVLVRLLAGLASALDGKPVAEIAAAEDDLQPPSIVSEATGDEKSRPENSPSKEDSPPQAARPNRTINLKIERYLALEEDGEIVLGKRISKSRWIIFGLLLAAEGGRIPLSALISHVPVWAALLKKKDEPDEGAVKRMLSKMNTLDLRPLGVPYTVKTKKDRKTGVLHVFLDGLNDASARGYGRP